MDGKNYLMYDTPPTRTYNWQCGLNPKYFQPENGVYQGIRAADFSKLYQPPTKKNPLRSKISNLLQRVLLQGQRNRICHQKFRQNFTTNLYCQSTELPIDWLVYYDAVSRICRDPTEFYGFIF